MPVCQKCQKQFPNWLKIGGKNRPLNHRKYCLECSPYGEHNTKKLVDTYVHEYKCKCGEINPDKFYGHKHSICGKCHNEYSIRIGHDKKAFARQLLGGECVACGFNKYENSLDIHHLNPLNKDPNFPNMRCWSLERIKNELKECVLLCRNCHTALHCGVNIDFGH
jgi:hypothetical protein